MFESLAFLSEDGPVIVSSAVPPNIRGEELNATVMLGSPVELRCQSDAIPPPTLSWRKDGRPLFRKPGLTVSADGSVLKVDLVIYTDALTSVLLVSPDRLQF